MAYPEEALRKINRCSGSFYLQALRNVLVCEGIFERSEFRHLRITPDSTFVGNHKKHPPIIKDRGMFLQYGVPGGIRTHDPQRRRLILYPTELRVLRIVFFIHYKTFKFHYNFYFIIFF